MRGDPMSDLPQHVEKKWELIERKAQISGATLSNLSGDIEDALKTYMDWWLKEYSAKQLTQANSRENGQSDSVKDDPKS
jgi:hypothetical protein